MNRRPSLRQTILGILLLSLVLVGLSIWSMYAHREKHVIRLIEEAGQSAGVVIRVESATIEPGGRVELRNVHLGDLGHIGYLELAWTWKDLARRRVSSLRVHGVELRLSELLKLQESGGSKHSPTTIQPFVLEKLVVGQGVLMLDDLGPGLPPVPLRIGQATPLFFENLYLGGESSDPAALAIQTVELIQLALYSPYDPLSPVLSFEKITLQFSWAGIQAKHIDRLAIENPMIYVGDDLFWFVEQIQQKKQEEVSPADADTPWVIGNLGVIGGRLIVTTFGRPGFTLPVIFNSEQSGVVLSNFAETPLKTELEIPNTHLNYPEYGVRVSNLRGKLQFSLPPGEAKTENIVNTILMDSISWKGVTATEAWLSVTFDKNGIYGELGGSAYGGYASGNLNILVNENLRWVADVSLTDTSIRPVAEMLAPEYIIIDGGVSGTVVVHGQQKNIEEVDGSLRWEQPGSLTVVAIDDVLEKLPEEWSELKRQLAEVSLTAFRHYNYDSGICLFRYGPPASFLDLKFASPQGGRHFSIRWHDLRDKPGFGW